MSETKAGFWDDAEVISAYTREDALGDGVLVDVTEWASHKAGFLGGFSCPVAMTQALWVAVDIDNKPSTRRPVWQSTRGRAHDVLWMASLKLRQLLKRNQSDGHFPVLLQVGRKKKHLLRVVADGDGVTIGFREDF